MGLHSRDIFASCLIAGLKKAARIVVNFQKLQDIIQKRDEIPSEFLDRLTQALLQYTSLDPETPERRHVLMTYFLAQSYPDIKAKLKKLEQGPATPQTEILTVAFKVFHDQEEEKERRKQKADQANFQMLAQLIKPQPGRPSTNKPPHQELVSSAEKKDSGQGHAPPPDLLPPHAPDATKRATGDLIAQPPEGEAGRTTPILSPP